MGIKLDVYLKRTQQDFGKWLIENNVTDASELIARCSYLGLSASNSDVVMAKQLLKNRKPVDEIPTIEIMTTTELVDEVKDETKLEPLELSPQTGRFKRKKALTSEEEK